MTYYDLDEQNNVIEVEHIPSAMFETKEGSDRRRVATDMIGGVRISTVFLSIDHGDGDGPPVLFETMVFGGQFDQDQARYTTWAEAEIGHKAMVRLRKAGLHDDH